MGILGVRAVLNPGLPALQSPSPAALNAITCSREMPKSRAQAARGPGFTYPQHSQCEYGSNKGHEWTQIKLKINMYRSQNTSSLKPNWPGDMLSKPVPQRHRCCRESAISAPPQQWRVNNKSPETMGLKKIDCLGGSIIARKAPLTSVFSPKRLIALNEC